MADNHVLNTRIKLKYDTYANWIANDPVLFAGEVAIATVADNEGNKTSTGFQNLPNVVIKVGDGSSKYSALKFVSALAADVHGWAKEVEKPKYTATEIDGLEGYIAGQIQDTDTQYEIKVVDADTYKLALYSWPKGVDHNTAGTLVSEINLSDIDTRLDTIEAAIGEGGTVAQKIQAAVEALDYAGGDFGEHKFATKVTEENGIVAVEYAQPEIADVNGLETALAGKQTNLEFAAAYDATNNKVALQSTVTEAVAGIAKTETEEAGKFVTHMTQANGVVTTVRRALVAEDIPELAQSKIAGLTDALNAKQDELVIADEYNAETNPVATRATVTAAVADLNGAMHFEGVVEKDPTTNTTEENAKYSAGDVVLFGIYEYVYDGAAWWPLGAEGIYQLKADAETQHETLQKAIDDGLALKQDELGFEGEYNKDNNKVVTKNAMTSAITAAIDGLDNEDAAVANEFITAVHEVNGIVTVERAQATIANIDGLTTRLESIDTAISTKQDAVEFADGYDKATNKAATVATVTNAINALDKADTAVEGQFVTAVPQENGVVTVARAAVTTDHIQQGTKTLVFDCGTSANSDITA